MCDEHTVSAWSAEEAMNPVIAPTDQPACCSRCRATLDAGGNSLTVQWRDRLFLYCGECKSQMEAALK